MNQLPKISLKRKIAGAALIAVGILAMITPLTPGGWLLFVGLEIFGIRIFFGRSIRGWIDHLRSKIKWEHKEKK